MNVMKLKKVYRVLDNIKKFRVKQIYPILLILFKKYKDWVINIEKLNKFYEELEKITFLFIVSDFSPSIIEWIYSDYSIKISTLDLYIDIKKNFTELKRKLHDKLQALDFDWIFDNIIYNPYNNSWNKIINYILQKIELNWDSENLILDSSIEHIYPKDPEQNDDWLEELDINKIWNLTLLTSDENSKLWNEVDFDIKKTIYSKSSLKITNSLKNYDGWDIDSINDRHTKLKEHFLSIFKIN